MKIDREENDRQRERDKIERHVERQRQRGDRLRGGRQTDKARERHMGN